MGSYTVTLNSTDIKIINLLKHNEYVSGESIAKELGISRTSVWKTVKKISTLGLISKATSGKGYTLAKDINLLNKDSIVQKLNVEAQNLFKIKVSDVVESTNKVLFEAAKSGNKLGFNVLLAEQQSNGRGRLGRNWITPFAHQLAVSCHFSLDTGVANLYGLSLAIGISIIDVLKDLGCNELGLKWPNDIYTVNDHKKVGGILIEMQQEAEGPLHLVIGLGINCLFTDSLDNISDVEISSLDQVGMHINRNDLCAEILNAFSKIYIELIKGKNIDSYLAKWPKYNVFHNKAVLVQKNDGEVIRGVDSGIDKDGSLVVKSTGKTHKIYGNLCSIRLEGK